MYSYVVDELPELVARNFPIDINKQSIMGHSMGGPRRADHSPEEYGQISLRVGLCAHLLAHELSVGKQSLEALFR